LESFPSREPSRLLLLLIIRGLNEVLRLKLLVIDPIECKEDVLVHLAVEASTIIVELLQIPQEIFYLV
jgi:hypothetical protein